MSREAERFADWAEKHAGLADARIVRRLTGGNANVTSLVETAEGPVVLRHPPADAVSDLASAGIAREYRFLEALAGKAPVAEPLAFCEDRDIIGAPFSLTRFVEGHAITDSLPDEIDPSASSISALGEALIDALATVHDLDPARCGIEAGGGAKTFVSRQIARWREVRQQAAVRDLPGIERLGRWLEDNAPEPEALRIVHCDYHLDNVLIAPGEARVNAILDWEMASVADPLVDLGLVTALWNRDESQPLGFAFVQRVSNSPDVCSGEELARRWAQATGLSVRRLAYFQAFALWRLAAIVEGAFVLLRQGKVDGEYERGLETDVPALLEAAERFARSEEGR